MASGSHFFTLLLVTFSHLPTHLKVAPIANEVTETVR